MSLRKRAPGLVCLLLLTAAAVLLAGRPTPAAPPSGPEDQEISDTLEEDTLHFDEPSPVRIISLKDLEPADTAAEHVFSQGAEDSFLPADPAEMAEILAELYLNDGTCIRLFATAEGLVHGAFLRPGGQWIRFVQLCGDQGDAAFLQSLSLTSFSGILGKEGFLLRYTAGDLPEYIYDYCWFDETGALQTLRARFDPVALDLDGDAAAELVWETAEWQSCVSFYCQDADGILYQVTPAEFIDSPSASLAAVEREGPGPVRLIYRCRTGGGDAFCAVTLENDQLYIEENIVYVPAQTETAALPADPTAGMTVPVRLSITGPGGQHLADAGESAVREFQSMLWEGSVHTEGAVLVPTDAPLNQAAAYTITFTPQTGDPLSWTMDSQGLCRFSGLEDTYRMISTGLGSLPEWCWDTMALYCAAARTAPGGR